MTRQSEFLTLFFGDCGYQVDLSGDVSQDHNHLGVSVSSLVATALISFSCYFLHSYCVHRKPQGVF